MDILQQEIQHTYSSITSALRRHTSTDGGRFRFRSQPASGWAIGHEPQTVDDWLREIRCLADRANTAAENAQQYERHVRESAQYAQQQAQYAASCAQMAQQYAQRMNELMARNATAASAEQGPSPSPAGNGNIPPNHEQQHSVDDDSLYNDSTPSTPSLREQYRPQLNHLREMGYLNEDQCLALLVQHHGDLTATVDKLLQSTSPKPDYL